MQSFGEGLDLPGKLCETVLITKLPFAPPDSPVEEAKSEWLEKNQGNPFYEISVPAVALKLQQWVRPWHQNRNRSCHHHRFR